MALTHEELETIADIVASRVLDKLTEGLNSRVESIASSKVNEIVDSIHNDESMIEGPLLSGKEAAAMLGMSKCSFYKHGLDKLIEHVVLPGSKWKRYPERCVIAMLAQRRSNNNNVCNCNS